MSTQENNQSDSQKMARDASLYRALRSMHWNDGKLAVIEARDLKLGVQTYSGDMLDEAIFRFASVAEQIEPLDLAKIKSVVMRERAQHEVVVQFGRSNVAAKKFLRQFGGMVLAVTATAEQSEATRCRAEGGVTCNNDSANLATAPGELTDSILIGIGSAMQNVGIEEGLRRARKVLASTAGAVPVTPQHIEQIKDLLLPPVTEDDARTARDLLQSLHFDLSMAQQDATPSNTSPVGAKEKE